MQGCRRCSRSLSKTVLQIVACIVIVMEGIPMEGIGSRFKWVLEDLLPVDAHTAEKKHVCTGVWLDVVRCALADSEWMWSDTV